MVRFRFAVAVVFSALVASSAFATTYYVSTSGNDANAGALATPFKTINRATALAHAGDTIDVRAGVYPGPISITSVGTATAPIVIHSYPGELAVIDGTGTAANTDLVTLYTAQYVQLSGFEIRNATRSGISGWLSSHITLSGNNIHNCQSNGIYAGADTFGEISDITIDGNTVHDNVLSNQYHTLVNGGWKQALSVQYANGAKITNNTVYHNDGEGIDFILTTNGLARGNQVYDNFSMEIYLDNVQNTTVDSNFAYSTGLTRYYRNSQPATTIGVANENYGSDALPASNLVITNNIGVRGRFGFYYGNDNGGGLKNSTIANNTFYLATDTMLYISADVNSGDVLENNVFSQTGAVMTNVANAGITFRNNLWYGGNSGTAAGASDVIGDPRLSNAGGVTASDYRITSLSPALGHALGTAIVTKDYFGAARVIPTDIGAHQFSTSSSTQTVSAPTSVTASATSSTSVTVGWAASSGATTYTVYRNGAKLATDSASPFVDSTAAASTTYTYTVTATSTSGIESAPSLGATVTTPAGSTSTSGAPAAPTNVSASPYSTTAITVKWTASAGPNVVNYAVYRGGVKVALLSPTVVSWTNTLLTSNTTYTYYVVAINSSNVLSAASNSATATTLTLVKKKASLN